MAVDEISLLLVERNHLLRPKAKNQKHRREILDRPDRAQLPHRLYGIDDSIRLSLVVLQPMIQHLPVKSVVVLDQLLGKPPEGSRQVVLRAGFVSPSTATST